MFASPGPCSLIEQFSITFILRGDHCVLGVVRLRIAEQGLQGEQGSANGEGRRPLVLQDVQADGPGLRGDVGVPDLGVESHLRGLVGVVRGDRYVYDEGASLVHCVRLCGNYWALDYTFPVGHVRADVVRSHA